MTPQYDVYVSDVSYFSGKFEAYLHYRDIPYNRLHADAKTFATTIFDNTGMMQVPTVHDRAQNIWLRDSTPMIQWFEAQHDFPMPLMPADPAQQFLHKLLEDFADEWLWQPAMYWRWMFKPSAKLLGRRIADEVMHSSPLPTSLAARYYSWRQKHEWLHRDGMTKANQQHIADRYITILLALDAILQTQSYLAGNQPGLVDFGFFGPFFRHFGIDPYPAEIMRSRAPHVYAWLGQLWNYQQQESETARSTWVELTTPAWQPIWQEINQAYLPYLATNASAWQQQNTRFDFNCQGYVYPKMKTTQYRVWCLEQLQQLYAELGDQDKTRLTCLTSKTMACLSESNIASGLTHSIPCKSHNTASKWQRLRLMCFGTPRDKPKA